MIPIAIKLFMGGLLKRLTAAFAWATASTAHLLIVALCVSILGNAWLFRGRQAARVSAAKWEIAYDKQKTAYELAQKQATAEALSVKLAQEAKDEQRKKDADYALKLDMAHDRRRADDYAASHWVRYQAPRDPSSSADLPETPAIAEVDHGPGDTAFVDGIAISRVDFEICTVNSRRLDNAHNWSLPIKP